MAFMDAYVTEKQDWIECDTAQGTYFLHAELIHLSRLQELLAIDSDEARADVFAMLKDYLEVSKAEDLNGVEIRHGYGVRLSASGYMDCTDWEVYGNKRQAFKRARELQRESDGDCE